MSTNSIPVSYTGFRSTANAVGAYIKDWKLAAKASYTLEDLLTPGFLGSAVAIYRDAVHKEINGETIVVGGSSAGHKAMFFNAGAQLNFFNVKCFLFLTRLFFAFLLLVTILAVIHNPAHRRFRCRSDLH